MKTDNGNIAILVDSSVDPPPPPIKVMDDRESIVQADYVEGVISDESGNVIVEPVTITLVNYGTDREIAAPAISTDGTYWASSVTPFDHAVLFKAVGFEPLKVRFATLMSYPDVTMKKSKSGAGQVIEAWQIALIAGAVVLYISRQKKKGRKVGAFSTSDVFPIMLIAGGLIGFSLVKAILEKLGLWDSKDTKDLDNAATDPNSFWNPNFWKTAPGGQYSYSISRDTANQYAREIYNSFGAFNDCEECVKAVFRRLRTKANASYLAWEFNNQYSIDLLDFLRGGWWPQDRLSDADVNEINQFLINLPKY